MKQKIMDSHKELIAKQKTFFSSLQTKSILFRKKMLKKLKEIIQQNEELLYEAVYKDFKKSRFDTYTTELSFIYHEIDYYIKNLSKLAKPKRVRTNIVNQLGKSRIYAEPYGNCLVIGAWNYPYELSLGPAIAAIAAGNTVILKPSEIVPHTSAMMATLVNENFDSAFFHVVEGGIPETTSLLNLRYDKIFFTGSPKVGKIVYKAATEHLTPVALELGGKSPVIVTASANMDVAARRIVWGKFLNAGQTCIAPDYLLVDKSIEKIFLQKLKNQIEKFDYSKNAEHFTRIVNERNVERLQKMIIPEKVYVGGEVNKSECYIAPTILQKVTWDDAVMQEEIFGPILPVLTYTNLEEAFAKIREGEKPLSAYLFTSKGDEKQQFLNTISFGGGCINDTVMHFTNANIPFGGVGNSGIGNYHGNYGFDTFSHSKSVLEKSVFGEPNLKYPPYTKDKLKWIKKLL